MSGLDSARRVAAAFAALRDNAAGAAVRREQHRLSAEWASRQLQGRVLATLAEAVARRRQFELQLSEVARAAQQDDVREAFGSWRASAALTTAERQLVAAARRRFARQCLQNRFAAWRAATREAAVQRARLERHWRQHAARLLAAAFAGWQAAAQRESDLQQRLEVGRARIAHMRAAWALDVWRQRTSDAMVEQQLVAGARR